MKIRTMVRAAITVLTGGVILAATPAIALADPDPAYGTRTDLPTTGFPVGPVVVAGLVLLLAGVVLTTTFRRRAHRST